MFDNTICGPGFVLFDCMSTLCAPTSPETRSYFGLSCPPGVVLRLFQMQIANYLLLWACNSPNAKASQLDGEFLSILTIQVQHRIRSGHSSGPENMAIGGSSPAQCMGSNLPTIICPDKIHGGHRGDDDEDQQSPNEKGAPNKIGARSLKILRFACHFHKRSPSRYCSTACDGRYKKCEGPGWENLASIK